MCKVCLIVLFVSLNPPKLQNYGHDLRGSCSPALAMIVWSWQVFCFSKFINKWLIPFHSPFSSLNSLSAKILHLRSYLSCACSCSIFMSRLMVSVLMPGLPMFSSSNSMFSCCQMRGNHMNSLHVERGKQLLFLCTIDLPNLSHLVVGKRWVAGLFSQPELVLHWFTAKLLRVSADFYHLDRWLCWTRSRVSLGWHGWQDE